MIDLKEFNDVLIYNTGSLYGFKLVSKARGSWKPMLFANSEEERKKWINQIRNKIDRFDSRSIHHYSPPIIRGQFYDPYDNQSVLDKWLLKLNLNDEKIEQYHYFNNISNSAINMNYSKTTSSTCSNNKQSRIHSRSDSNASIIGSKNKSFESIDYSNFESPNNSISELPSSSFTRRLSIEYAQKKYTEVTQLYRHRFISNREPSKS